MFYRTQHFNNLILGNKTLNKIGLHIARIKLSNFCHSLRCFNRSKLSYHKKLEKDGLVIIENFLEKNEFLVLKKEIKSLCDGVDKEVALNTNVKKGYGQKIPFEMGFHHYDGGTLNRFIKINKKSTPESYQFAKNKLLEKIYTRAIGCTQKSSKFFIYQTIYHEIEDNPDIQSVLHRDTFQPAIKLWYFTEDVGQDDGAFEYILGSHDLNKSRMAWEKERSIKASRPTNDSGGAFRLSEEERKMLGYPEPTPFFTKENTLIIADVRGFHRRGHGRKGHKRYAIYASFRPHPFIPFSR